MSIRLLPPEQRIIRRVTQKAEDDTAAAFFKAVQKVVATIGIEGLVQVLGDQAALDAYVTAIGELGEGGSIDLLEDEAAAAFEAELMLTAKVQTILGELSVRLEPLLEKMILRAGESALPTFNETMALSPGLSIEAFQSQVVGLAREITAEAVTAITDQARATLRGIVSRGFDEGLSPSQIAKRIAGEIGLDNVRAGAFEKFIAALQADPGDLSEEELQAKIDKEYSRLLKSRSWTIARTETAAAAAETQLAFWQASVEEGRISESTYVREWIRIPAAKPCPICGPLQGKKAKINGVYRAGGRTYKAPPAHPNCKCGERLVLWHGEEKDLPAAA